MDYATAHAEFRPLAEKGMAAAQTNLGLLYSKGWGVRADDAHALKWYRLAAKQNQPIAQNNLGAMFIKGIGGPKDEVFGTMWLILAAENKYAAATKALQAQEKRLTVRQLEIARQLAELWKEKQTIRVKAFN
jgi:TPR repeat protein